MWYKQKSLWLPTRKLYAAPFVPGVIASQSAPAAPPAEPAGIEHIATSSVHASSGTTTHTLTGFSINQEGDNLKLIVGIQRNDNDDISSVQYNSVSLNQALTPLTAASQALYMYYLDGGDFPEDGNLVATFVGNGGVHMFAALYKNVKAGAPSDTSTDDDQTVTLSSITLQDVPEGALIFDLVAGAGTDTSYTPGGDGSPEEIVDESNLATAHTIAAAHRIGVSAGNYTITQTAANQQTRQFYMAAVWEVAE